MAWLTSVEEEDDKTDHDRYSGDTMPFSDTADTLYNNKLIKSLW